MNSNQNFLAMKKLLTSWNVEILYGLFKEEDICMKELKMMKFRHVAYLLKNFKMGVKIRFEYNLENWRNEIGKPLQIDEYNSAICCNCKMYKENAHNIEPNHTTKILIEKENRNGNHIETEVTTDQLELEHTDPQPVSPQSDKSDHTFHDIQTPNEMPILTPIPVLSSAAQLQNRLSEDRDLCTATDLLTTSLGVDEAAPKFKYKNGPDGRSLSLTQILQLSGSRGMTILKYYDENKHLTNTHRIQLIQLIVDFFEDNDYHLSLNMSHNLEWQILKIFPTEKLGYYRTEKRGKIYVKFSNMKRYKRDRNSKFKPDIEKLHNQSYSDNKDGPSIKNNMIVTNMDTTSCDTWPDGAEAEIEIKAEHLSD